MNWVELFPISASSHAPSVDYLYAVLILVSAFFTGLVFFLILAFCIRYRRSANPESQPVQQSTGLELFWTAIPLLITIVLFIWGATVYVKGETPPDDAEQVYVVGKQWMWKIQHPEGRREINELHVPVGKDVKLTLTSQDVIHSFYVPAFRMKQDAVPGQYHTMWFRATRTGTFHLFCAEFCGTNHSRMIGRIVVLGEEDYEKWLAGTNELDPIEAGKQLFTEFDCISCHGTGQRARCPTLGGLYGSYVALEGGGRAFFDEIYIRESVLDPNAKVAAGFEPIMPSFKGQLNEEQILDLMAYIKSLSPSPRRQGNAN